jgi:VanZ family protein
LIFAVSQVPNLRSPLGLRSLRKAAHILEYGLLAGLLARGFFKAGYGWMGALYAFLCSVAFGASDEFHQLFVPGRHGTLGDIRYDAAGVFLGLTFFLVARAVHGKATGAAFSSQFGDHREDPPGLPPRT